MTNKIVKKNTIYKSVVEKSSLAKLIKKISQHFRKVWTWQFCADCGRGILGQ